MTVTTVKRNVLFSLPDELHKRARHAALDADQPFQGWLVDAVRAYLIRESIREESAQKLEVSEKT
jgi:hypothetical protein